MSVDEYFKKLCKRDSELDAFKRETNCPLSLCKRRGNLTVTIVSEFTGNILLVGINYDKKTKKHECRIERWNKTQVVAGENSSSKREKSRSIKVEKIVGFCSVPKTLEEIAVFMGVKDKNFMKKMYIDPALGTRLRMTEPDTPTSPTQQYVARED